MLRGSRGRPGPKADHQAGGTAAACPVVIHFGNSLTAAAAMRIAVVGGDALSMFTACRPPSG